MNIPTEHLVEIAETLEMGLTCYYHRPTGAIEAHPDLNDAGLDIDLWEDVIEKIENDRDSYERLENMDSKQAFKVMEDFAYSITDLPFRDQILDRLSAKKPFQNFKMLVDFSDHRDDWFRFKRQAYIEFVKRQLK